MCHVITSCWRALAVAGGVAIGSAFAQEPAATPVKPTSVVAPVQSPSPQMSLPTCLEKLNLTPQQQAKIQEVVCDYDADVSSVWKQFSDRYLETIRTEAILLSAIEDNLTDTQRQQVRDQRRRVARHEKAIAATTVKAQQESAKPVSAVDEELAIVGVPLTQEQETAAEAIQEKYLSHLRSLNRGIQGLHNRLVSLEADKFVEIEKVLTKDQLKQLCEIRQNAPPTSPGEVARVNDAARTK
jgi:hypothetical protein